MTTASQAPLKLPPTFAGSFWASHPAYPSYRSAITHLYTLLQHGLDENTSVLAYIRQLVDAQHDLVESLRHTTDKISTAVQKEKPIFRGARDQDAIDGHSSSSSDPSSHLGSIPRRRNLLVNALYSAAAEPLAASHIRVTQQLTRTVLDPFGEWSYMHAERIKDSWAIVDEWLDAFERGQDDLDKLRHQYETKCRQADEAEDDARFSGVDVNEDWEAASAGATNADSQQQLPSSQSSETIIEKQPTPEAESLTDSPDPATLDPVKLERRQTLRKQFGFSPRVTSGGPEFQAPKRSVSGSSDKSTAQDDTDTAPSANTSLKRSGTISAALTSALSAPAVQAIKDRLAAAAGTGGIAEKWKRLRKEAEKLEIEYLQKARSVDTLRCRLEDALSEQLTSLQKFELDRLVAVRALIQSYSTAFNTLNPALASRLQPLLQSHEPSVLIAKLITSARTGSYRPQTEVFHPFYHDEWVHGGSTANPAVGYGTGWAGFGMHLNARWRAEVLAKHNDAAQRSSMLDEGGAGARDKSAVTVALPLALSHLLSSLERAYAEPSLWPTPTDASDSSAARAAANAEKRKSWIYEVPLKSAHACRQAIISHMMSSHPGAELGAGLPALLDKFDPPTKAMTVKVWLAELQEGLVPEENWHLISSLYKAAESVEAKWRTEKREKRQGKARQSGEVDNAAASPPAALELDDDIRATIRKGVLDDLSVVLGKLSSPHLVVLDSVVSHLKHLVSTTSDAGEADEVYINKLALSIGRFVLRPAQMTHSTIASPIPVLLLVDLVTYYEELIPPAISRKSKLEEEAQVAKRKMPTRKRTKPIDTRIRRSQIGMGGNGSVPEVPPLPKAPLPSIVTDTVTPATQSASPVDAGTDATPTPIAERMLSSQAPPAASSSTLEAPPTTTSEAGGSNDGSAYGTPSEETDAKRLESGEGEGDDTIASMTTTPATTSSYDEDKPLSNVARLSRQFGSSSSSSSSGGITRSGSSSSSTGVRGPRPAGARVSRDRDGSSSGAGGVAAIASRLQQQQQQ